MPLVDEELHQGELGVGIPVSYISNTHTRFAGVLPPTEGALGIQELMSNGMALSAPVMVALRTRFAIENLP